HEPLPTAYHLAHHQPLAWLAAGVERHGRQAGQVERRAREHDDQQLARRRPHAARQLRRGAPVVTVPPPWRCPPSATTTPVGAIAPSTRAATSAVATAGSAVVSASRSSGAPSGARSPTCRPAPWCST